MYSAIIPVRDAINGNEIIQITFPKWRRNDPQRCSLVYLIFSNFIEGKNQLPLHA